MLDIIYNEDTLIHIIKLDNNTQIRYMFIEDNLNIEGGNFWKEYERISN